LGKSRLFSQKNQFGPWFVFMLADWLLVFSRISCKNAGQLEHKLLASVKGSDVSA
jgi:hypothetical protein